MREVSLLALSFGLLTLAQPCFGQCQSQKVSPPDAQYGEYFGICVSMSGDWAIIGAQGDNEIAQDSGAAYIYHRVGSTWVQAQKLKASDAAFGAQFGTAVAIDGEVAVVTAWTASPISYAEGAAYVFELQQGTWVQTARVVANDALPNNQFGNSVSISGSAFIVGDYQEGHAGAYSGAAYVFERTGSAWNQTQKLSGNDTAQGDGFGYAVSLSENVAVVGAINADAVGSNSGAAYVFERNGSAWLQTAKLLPHDAAAQDYIGAAVGVSGPVCMVSAPFNNAAGTHYGGVYAFEKVAGVWTETQKILPIDDMPQLDFPSSIAIEGTTAVIGTGASQDNGTLSGSAYVFQYLNGAWTQTGKMLPHDAQAHVIFGGAVGLSGTWALAGAAYDNVACPRNPICYSGSAYFFELAPTAIQYGDCASGAPCGNLDTHGGCANSSGQGAVLAACGTASVSLDDTMLEVTHLPGTVNGLFFRGGGHANTPYGDGIVHISSGGLGVWRFGIQHAAAGGILTLGPGIVAMTNAPRALAPITVGQTWNFQCWYRNAGGPCGSNFNFSNAVAITFGP
jgi:hypothetical protein